MKKASIAQVLVFVLLIAFASFAIAQMARKPFEKTVTPPSGEVILDMSGKWDTQSEFYGPLGHAPFSPLPDILTIMQFGTEFSSINEIGGTLPKGTEIIKGKLDKDGFKAIYMNIGSHHMSEWVECKWEISENGYKVLLACGERVKSTHTRR